MTYEGRALYNLLQMSLKQNPDLEVEPWQVEVYRDLSEEELFRRLEVHEIFLDKTNFLLYVEECDSPEDLADCLYLEEDSAKHGQVYLCVFELWRRLAPHKQSLSLFVDQFDHLVEQYEGGNLEVEEDLQAAVESFQMILDDNVDEGGDPREGYHFFSSFSCHDLEVFIYEYITLQIEEGNYQYASELLEGFYTYVDNKRWFDLIKARLVSEADADEGQVMVGRLLESLEETPELYLLYEVLHFLVYIDDSQQFKSSFEQACEQIETEEDLSELYLIALEYLEAAEDESRAKKVKELIEGQKGIEMQDSISPSDPKVLEVKKLI